MTTRMSASEIDAYLDEVFPQLRYGGRTYFIEDVGPMTARMRCDYHEKHLRPGGTISGPTMMALADLALYAAILAQIGPVVDQSQLDQDLKYIQIAKDEGGKLVFGGELLKRDTPGFYLAPALFTETTNAMRISREEVFGPVANIVRVKDYDEALAVANDTEFGLSSGICTTSLKHATHFKRNSEAGMVMVNLPTAGVDYHVPFGGRKGSSYGPREQGAYAKEFYTTVKTAYTLA